MGGGDTRDREDRSDEYTDREPNDERQKRIQSRLADYLSATGTPVDYSTLVSSRVDPQQVAGEFGIGMSDSNDGGQSSGSSGLSNVHINQLVSGLSERHSSSTVESAVANVGRDGGRSTERVAEALDPSSEVYTDSDSDAESAVMQDLYRVAQAHVSQSGQSDGNATIDSKSVDRTDEHVGELTEQVLEMVAGLLIRIADQFDSDD